MTMKYIKKVLDFEIMGDVEAISKSIAGSSIVDEIFIKSRFTSDVIDRTGDIIEKKGTQNAMKEYRDWRNVRYMHLPEPVGIAEHIGEGDGAKLKWNEVIIRLVDPKAIRNVVKGVIRALSVGILIDLSNEDSVEFMEDGGWRIKEYMLAEISLVDSPAQQEATFLDVALEDFTGKSFATSKEFIRGIREAGSVDSMVSVLKNFEIQDSEEIMKKDMIEDVVEKDAELEFEVEETEMEEEATSDEEEIVETPEEEVEETPEEEVEETPEEEEVEAEEEEEVEKDISDEVSEDLEADEAEDVSEEEVSEPVEEEEVEETPEEEVEEEEGEEEVEKDVSEDETFDIEKTFVKIDNSLDILIKVTEGVALSLSEFLGKLAEDSEEPQEIGDDEVEEEIDKSADSVDLEEEVIVTERKSLVNQGEEEMTDSESKAELSGVSRIAEALTKQFNN